MAKTTSSASKKGSTRTRNRFLSPTAIPPPPSIATLNRIQAAAREEFSRPKLTKASYDGYIRRAKKFLRELVADRRKKNTEDGIDTDLLEKAFDNPPNKYSVLALESYLSQKCFNEKCGKDTAGGIQGAFTDFWDHMDMHGRYSGKYEYDEATETVKGCPARAMSFKSMINVINNRAKVKGGAATRNHAEAMDLPGMNQVMGWSETEYPSERLKHRPKNDEERIKALRQAEGRAMFSTGFNTWARNFELTALRARHITRDSVGPGPHYYPCIRVFLEHRKGWESKGDDGPLESKHYNIYAQDIPAIDMYTQLRDWLDYLESTIGRPLEPDEFIFPFISSNGTIDLNREMSRPLVQKFINDFTKGAGLPKYYTTHCFRRGGAQYRSTGAPLGERWSLKAVRWWGGWAEGESVDTLMKYLFDSLQSIESSYCDQLCPSGPPDHDQSFMGEKQLVQPATRQDLHDLTSKLITAFQNPHAITNLHSSVSSPYRAASGQLPISTATMDPPTVNTTGLLSNSPTTPINPTGLGFAPVSSLPPNAVNLSTVTTPNTPITPITFNHLTGTPPVISNPYAPWASTPSTLRDSTLYALNHNGSALLDPNFAQAAGTSFTGTHLFNPLLYPPPAWSHLPTSALPQNRYFAPVLDTHIHTSEAETSISASTWNPHSTNFFPPSMSHTGVVGADCQSRSGVGPAHSARHLASSTRVLNQCASTCTLTPPPPEIPPAIAVIPDLERHHKGCWREAVSQWKNANPQTGIALKDWPKGWSTYHPMGNMSSKHRTRMVVGLEYQRLGGTDHDFLAAHPEADTVCFSTLYNKISDQNGRHHRKSKNGPPDVRRRRRS